MQDTAQIEKQAIRSTTCAMPVLMTQKQAAEYLGLSESWFERDRWAGASLPFLKFGRTIRYRAEDVQAFLDASLQTAKR